MHLLRDVSWFNRILITVLALGGAWCVAARVWPLGVVLVAAAVIMGVVTLRAAGGRGSDTMRLDAVQPYDEREQAASEWSFAVVGRIAIVGLVTVFVVQGATRDGRVDPVVTLVLVTLCLVWAGAIRVAVRRA